MKQSQSRHGKKVAKVAANDKCRRRNQKTEGDVWTRDRQTDRQTGKKVPAHHRITAGIGITAGRA